MIDRLKVEVMIHLNIDLCVFIPIMCVWCVYLFDMYFDNSYIYIYIYLYTYCTYRYVHMPTYHEMPTKQRAQVCMLTRKIISNKKIPTVRVKKN